jgi:hypothetical protein
MDFRSVAIVEPFFRQTLQKLRARVPPPPETATGLEPLAAIGRRDRAAMPAGIIAHVSRCGSTLLANALRSGAACTLLSEPAPISELLRTPRACDLSEPAQADLLAGIVSRFGSIGGQPSRIVIKLASEDLVSLARVRAIWPDVPCVIVTRDPVEVLISQVRAPTGWLRFRRERDRIAALAEIDPEHVDGVSDEELCARILARLYRAAADHLDAGCLLIDYREMQPAMAGRVIEMFSLETVSAPAISRAFEVYAKDPEGRQSFVDDSLAKRVAARGLLEACSEQWARAPYQSLLSRAKQPRH